MKRVLFSLVAVALLAAFTGGAVAQAATPYTASINFQPDKDRYHRGDPLTYVVTVRNAAGQRVPNTAFRVVRKHDRGSVGLPTLYTNALGQGRGFITVPTDPNQDNNYIQIYFNNLLIGQRRIPIG